MKPIVRKKSDINILRDIFAIYFLSDLHSCLLPWVWFDKEWGKYEESHTYEQNTGESPVMITKYGANASQRRTSITQGGDVFLKISANTNWCSQKRKTYPLPNIMKNQFSYLLIKSSWCSDRIDRGRASQKIDKTSWRIYGCPQLYSG